MDIKKIINEALELAKDPQFGREAVILYLEGVQREIGHSQDKCIHCGR